MDDERQVDLVRRQLTVGHLSERVTVDVQCRPLTQSAVGDVKLLHQLLQLLHRELTYVAIRGNSERVCDVTTHGVTKIRLYDTIRYDTVD